MEEYKLTQFAKGAGCGCKIAPLVLESILKNNRVEAAEYKNLMVGNASNDDASVYDLNNGSALLTTADFFMPIVDDAYTFGKVAAANSLSDVYAMGGRPITATALLGWPIDKLPAELAACVMDGARAVCKEAGILISGGHTIDSAEPFFGLSVNGMVAIEHLKRNSTAELGNVILMTKSLGVGILATAQKRALLLDEHKEVLINCLTQLNSIGEYFGTMPSVKAMTDITGFGIMGHLIEMAESSGLSAEIEFSKLPIIDIAKFYIEKNCVPDATYRNWNAYEPKTRISKSVDPKASFMILPDPQTNGGLLLAVDVSKVKELRENALAKGVELQEIGRFVKKGEKTLFVEF